MSIAKAEASLPSRERSEWPDPEENPRIVRYLKETASWLEADDEIDWCASFVNWCLEQAGYMGTSHPGARSFFWNRNSQFVSLSEPIYGCVAVRRHSPFSDPTWQNGKGHVGFFISSTPTTFQLLGGNQGNTVKAADYARESHDASGKPISKFVAYMMPVMN